MHYLEQCKYIKIKHLMSNHHTVETKEEKNSLQELPRKLRNESSDQMETIQIGEPSFRRWLKRWTKDFKIKDQKLLEIFTNNILWNPLGRTEFFCGDLGTHSFVFPALRSFPHSLTSGPFYLLSQLVANWIFSYCIILNLLHLSFSKKYLLSH